MKLKSLQMFLNTNGKPLVFSYDTGLILMQPQMKQFTVAAQLII